MDNCELEKIHKQLLDLEWRVKFLEMGMEDSVEFSKFVVDCISELQEDIPKCFRPYGTRKEINLL